MALLDVNGLNKSFGGLQAVNNASLTVEEGRTHAIIGPNGAGKSTFLNLVIGNLEADSGNVMFQGKSLLGMRPHQVNQEGVVRVFQSPQIYSEMTLLENTTIGALAKRDGTFVMNFFQHPRRRKECVETAEQALDSVNLLHLADEEAINLSYGDKRRLELAICLSQKPKLLLLDEPTAGMSQQETQSTIDLLKKLSKDEDMTQVIIEHDMHVVFSLAEHLTVLHQGAVISDGTPEEVKNDPKVIEAYLGGVEEL